MPFYGPLDSAQNIDSFGRHQRTVHPSHHSPVSPRPRAAFTLIELMVVVVIIGILVAILMPKLQNTKGRANAAALKSDLRNIAVAQEAYFYDHATYASDVTQLNAHTSPGVTVIITTPAPGAWMATATHPASYPLKCTLYFGPITPPPPAMTEGVPNCR